MGNIVLSRRSFVKMAATTTALAGLAASLGNSFIEADSALAAETSTEQCVRTSCRACISNCAVKAYVRNGRVVRLEGDEIDPMSKGRLCAKGLSGIQALYNPNRMKYPMKRIGERGTNEWERISWTEAIDTITDALMELYEKDDPMQLTVSTGGGGNPQFYSPHRFLTAFGGGNFFEPGCSQCYLPRNYTQPMMNGTSDNSIADSNSHEVYLEDNESECLVLWGTDPSQSVPAAGGRALANLRARGTKTVVIDPRFTPDASKADIWLPIRPGTDVAMMLSWINYIIENERYDKEFCLKWTNLPYLINESTLLTYRASELGLGTDEEYVVWDLVTGSAKAMPFPWDDSLSPVLDGEFTVNGTQSRTAFRALKEQASEWTLDKAAEVCWVDADKLEKGIAAYVEGSPHAGICLGVATDQYEQSAQCAMGTTILDIIMGNIQNPGNLTQARSGQNPGTYMVLPFDMFGPSELEASYETVSARLGYIEHKGLGYWFASHIPTLLDALKTGQPYKPKIWIDRSGNKLAVVGNARGFHEAVSNFELIVHMYMYPTTTSIEFADIILPTAEWLETDYAADRLNVYLVRQAATRLYEAVDETLIWSWLVCALADKGHERCKLALDEAHTGKKLGAYWRTLEDYQAFIASNVSGTFGKDMTWDEVCATLPCEFETIDEFKNTYRNYEKIDEETGKQTGFSTVSGKCEPYAEGMTLLGRTGGASGKDSHGYVLPPASVDYPPLPYYREPHESPLTDGDYPYALTEGRIPMYHHGTLRNIPYLRELYPVPETWINPITAAEIGVSTGDWCTISSRRGETHGRVKVTEGIAPKVIYQERFWNPELLSNSDPSLAWKQMNINILTKNDAPFNQEFGTYTLRGFQVNIKRDDAPPEGVWYKPTEFESWMPEASDSTGGGYAVYDA